MKKLFTFHFSLFTLASILLTSSLFLLTSCEYKDLCYDHPHYNYNLELKLNLKLDLEVDVEVSEEAHTKIDAPKYMKAGFYDTKTDKLIKTEFIEGTEGRIHVDPGTYNMVAYSFGTEWTQIRGEGDMKTIEAFTSDITSTKAPLLARFTRAGEEDAPGPIIYTPDHLLVTVKEVVIPPFTEENRVVVITATASTIVETYEFEVTNITGAEYISSVDAFVTNQARSNFFGRGVKNTEPATIYFPVEYNQEDKMLKTSFNTFGKLPGESKCFLHILIRDSEGKEYKVTKDITDQFEKEDHIIVIDDPIDIPAPTGGGGGIAPTVEEWEEVQHDVPIG